MTFDNQKWKSLTKKSILVKKPWFEVFKEEIQLPDGKVVPEYYEIEMPHYTAVFAVTVEQKIMVLRCYRHAIGEVTLTMPGGMIEKGESPLEGIKREFLEETGYKAKEWKSLGTFIGNSTRGCGTYHFFFANQAYPTKKADSGDLEEMELLLWTPEDVEQAMAEGRVHSLGVLSILLLGLRCLK
jgi:ADP-ribose pyrophosphatase|tara:strand:- start:309 stop:860 length:552 start_codon:yes stop_codon:yes gene_type:complete